MQAAQRHKETLRKAEEIRMLNSALPRVLNDWLLIILNLQKRL